MAVERGRIVETALEAESLRRSDELKTALLHGVSHEFRTPLTAIRTAAHALAEDPEGPAARELLAAMSAETGRLERLVANLLDLSRLEAGALVTRLDWCAPEEIVAGALEAAEPFLEGMPVAVRIDPDLPLVRADPVLCERILVNLLHNAVRHGRPPVSIAARRAGDRLELRVTDAGPGPDPAVAARLFDPFAAGPRTGGTGVGLALARGLAEAQGALLEHEVEGAGHDLRPGARPGAGPRGDPVTSGRVLVVDDEPQVLRGLSAALTAAGTAWTRPPPEPRPSGPPRSIPPTPWCSTCACRTSAAWRCAGACASGARPPSWWSPRSTRRRTRSRPSTPAPTTTSPSRTPWGSFSRACAPSCAGRRLRPARRPAVRFGDVEVDLARREVRRAGDAVHLTPHEYGLLAELSRHPDRVLTHRALLSAVWGPAYATRPTTCASTWATCAASSRTTPPARATSPPTRESATACAWGRPPRADSGPGLRSSSESLTKGSPSRGPGARLR